MPSRKQLAIESIDIEQEILKETVGSQDQVLAAYGGFNHIVFPRRGEISVRPMTLSPERVAELQSHLMLFYTGIQRTASDVAQTLRRRREANARQLRILNDLVEEAMAMLTGRGSIADFGDCCTRPGRPSAASPPRCRTG